MHEILIVEVLREGLGVIHFLQLVNTYTGQKIGTIFNALETSYITACKVVHIVFA